MCIVNSTGCVRYYCVRGERLYVFYTGTKTGKTEVVALLVCFFLLVYVVTRCLPGLLELKRRRSRDVLMEAEEEG